MRPDDRTRPLQLLRAAVLLLLVVVPGCCSAGPPPLALPKEVRGQAGDVIPVTADTLAKSVAWLSLDDGLRVVPPSVVKDSRTAHVVGCRPGRFRLKAIAGSGDHLSEWAETTVVIESGPSASARAEERKGQTSACCWLVVIEETARRTPAQAAILSDAALVAYVKAKGWRVRIADQHVKDSAGKQPRDLAPYLARAKGKQLPYVFVVDATGRPRHEGPVPSDARTLLADLRKVGG